MFYREDAYSRFRAEELHPEGWLRRQLEIQARGLAGNLDKVWPVVGDSVWFGGSIAEAECANYWMDGFLPLALLLRTPELLNRGKNRLGSLLRQINQSHSDGWLLPGVFPRTNDPACSSWSIILCCKMLSEYHAFSGDDEVLPYLEKGVSAFAAHLQKAPLGGWGKYRWFELLIPLFHLFETTGNPAYLEIAETVHRQGTNYRSLFEPFQMKEIQRTWSQDSHVVNLSMALKAAVLYSKIDERCSAAGKCDAFSEKMLATLQKYHGLPYGHFTGDECLATYRPNQGTELCGVVEAMYSDEWNFMVSGNPVWLDRLEKIAFNALPAALTADMWEHQYDQQVNQIGCVREEHPIWSTNAPDSNLFGLEPNCGCCTANHGQGFPKLAMCAFLHSKDAILSALPLPGTLTTKFSGTQLKIKLESDYPFSGKLHYTIECDRPLEFTFQVRIPSGIRSAEAEGKNLMPGSIAAFRRRWEGRSTLDVTLDLAEVWESRPTGMHCLFRGPLLFSRPIPFEMSGSAAAHQTLTPEFPPVCDYELRRTGEWGYAFASQEVAVMEHGSGDVPFSPENPPVSLRTKMAPIHWNLAPGLDHVCDVLPVTGHASGVAGEETLIPYACAKLRMTEMPLLDGESEDPPEESAKTSSTDKLV
ncbi:MAG: glycoside hydrolase family 127 protein [Victivallaceae bacterium]|nr:glycoside hydrolase family 127 protein [Victivallaceae bacterium]